MAGTQNLSNWNNIADSERLLAEHFRDLRENRNGPVFFIEHGLSAVDTKQVQLVVRQAAKHHSLQSSWWRGHPLPLLVTATEIGYAYRGTGTDFWPKLESVLSTHISLEARQKVRDLFESCSSQYGGARPPVTAWTTAFRLIAWPITHALVPVEFHRQLAATLANLRSDAQSLDDETLHRYVRIAARNPSVRFGSFLEDGSPAVPMIRALLGGENGEISNDTVTRIELDLTADRDARLDIEFARRRQRRLRKTSTQPTGPAPQEVRAGHLQLRFREQGQLALEVRFPTIQGPEADRLRRTLRRRLFRPRLWGVTSPVPCDWLFSGLPFPVNFHTLPEVGTPLLQDLDQLGIDRALIEILESFQLHFQPPLLFAANDTGDQARLVRGNEISTFRTYWLLAEYDPANRFASLSELGKVGPLACYALDPSHTRAADELDRLGYRIRQGLSVLIAGSPALEEGAGVPRFLVGDERIVVPKREHSPGARVDLGSESIPVDGNLVRVRVPEGKQVLEIASQDMSRREAFEGVRVSDHAFRRACWIELSADERTIQALLGGSVALRVDGVAPLEGLTLTVELEAGSWRTGTSIPLDALPQVLDANQELWHVLLNQATRERILQDQHPVVLHARAGALAEDSWTLERSLRPIWWIRGPEGPFLDSELGQVEHGKVSIARPAEEPVAEFTADATDAVLLAPLNPDESIFGPSVRFSTFCTSPAKGTLLAPPMERPRLRRSRSSTSGALGLQQLMEAWLRWAVAESDTFTAELRRQQAARRLDLWIAELTCGEVWARREEELRLPSADPWKLLVEQCLRYGRGLDELVQTTEQDNREIVRLAVAEIRRDHADLWVRIGPLAVRGNDSKDSLLGGEEYAELDAACARAYGQLAEQYRRVGKIHIAESLDSADPGAAPDQWDPVLESALAGSELRELGELLLPTDTARWLMSMDPTLIPIREIAEELHLWATKSQRAMVGDLPTEETMRAILALWIAPESAVLMDWRTALDTIVAERALARAARYLALRARSSRPVGAEE